MTNGEENKRMELGNKERSHSQAEIEALKMRRRCELELAELMADPRTPDLLKKCFSEVK